MAGRQIPRLSRRDLHAPKWSKLFDERAFAGANPYGEVAYETRHNSACESLSDCLNFRAVRPGRAGAMTG